MRGQAGFFDVEERRDPATHALEPVYSVHYNDYAARLQAAQAAHDVGIQRTCWQIHSITNWIGDTGFLKAARLPPAEPAISLH
jgi:hypothetical protein